MAFKSPILAGLVPLLGLPIGAPPLVAYLKKHRLAQPTPTTDRDDCCDIEDKRGLDLYFTHEIVARPFYPPRKVDRKYVTYFEKILVTPAFAEPLPRNITHAMGWKALVAKVGEDAITTPSRDVVEFGVSPNLRMLVLGDARTDRLINIWLGIPTGHVLDGDPQRHEPVPPDKPPLIENLALGMLIAWAADRVGLAPALAKRPRTKQLAKREITGRQFLLDELQGSLITSDLDPRVEPFLVAYQWGANTSEMRGGTVAFHKDWLAAFRGAVPSAYHVPDTWQAFDRYAPILDARWADWQKTKLRGDEPPRLYTDARRKRDAISIDIAARAPATVDIPDDTTERLMSLIGRSTTEPDVKQLLTSLGLPVGKTIDEQGSGKLGVSYMATRPQYTPHLPKPPPSLPKKAVLIEYVAFYAKGQVEHIRGLGTQVQFAQYPNALPRGLAFGHARTAVRKRLGKPSWADSDGTRDHYWLGKGNNERGLTVWYRNSKVCKVTWGVPIRWDEDD